MGVAPPRLAALLVVATLAGCAAPRGSWVGDRRRPSNAPDLGVLHGDGAGHAPDARVHVVRPGENLYRISLRYGVDVDELADLNDITDPRKLAVGRELVLPPSAKGGTRATAAHTRAEPKSGGSARPAKGKRPVLAWPVKGVLFSRFGKRGASRHDGIDIAAPEGTPITAAADGEVLYAGTQRGYGRIVIVRHAFGLITIYAHNSRNLVKEGDKVKAGQVIAKVGETGRATGPHCHFEVRRGTTPLRPLNFLPR